MKISASVLEQDLEKDARAKTGINETADYLLKQLHTYSLEERYQLEQAYLGIKALNLKGMGAVSNAELTFKLCKHFDKVNRKERIWREMVRDLKKNQPIVRFV
jgi:hypothetical protein